MLSFLNAISIFGYQLDWDASSAMFWLLVIQGVLILIEIAVFCTLIIRSNRKNKDKTEQEPAPQNASQPVVVIQQPEAKEVARELIGITLDTGVVQRTFTVGEEFNCDGLLVHAQYSAAPTLETIPNYSVVDTDPPQGTLGCFVLRPDLSVAGKYNVTVRYNDNCTVYPISVEEPQPEETVEEEPQEERVLQYITLNTDNVQKEFTAGDALNHDGLTVTAVFNTEPTEVQVDDYSVLAPDMSKEGNPTVTVVYQDRSVGYRITVNAAPEEPHREAQLIEEESFVGGTLRYDKSFQARFIQSDDDVKRWYTDIKNELLSFKKVHDRSSWKRETYKSGKTVVAKLAFRGKTLCLYLPLNASDYTDSKYQLEDVSNTPSNVETPSMYRIKNDKRAKYAVELIDAAMEKLELPRIERESEDYYVPYEGIVELIKKGLVKRNIKSAEDEAIFNQGKAEAAATEAEPQEIAPGIFVTPKTEE